MSKKGNEGIRAELASLHRKLAAHEADLAREKAMVRELFLLRRKRVRYNLRELVKRLKRRMRRRRERTVLKRNEASRKASPEERIRVVKAVLERLGSVRKMRETLIDRRRLLMQKEGIPFRPGERLAKNVSLLESRIVRLEGGISLLDEMRVPLEKAKAVYLQAGPDVRNEVERHCRQQWGVPSDPSVDGRDGAVMAGIVRERIDRLFEKADGLYGEVIRNMGGEEDLPAPELRGLLSDCLDSEEEIRDAVRWTGERIRIVRLRMGRRLMGFREVRKGFEEEIARLRNGIADLRIQAEGRAVEAYCKGARDEGEAASDD